jgi:hypothetical protein
MFTEQAWAKGTSLNKIKHCSFATRCPIDMKLQLGLIIIAAV